MYKEAIRLTVLEFCSATAGKVWPPHGFSSTQKYRVQSPEGILSNGTLNRFQTAAVTLNAQIFSLSFYYSIDLP